MKKQKQSNIVYIFIKNHIFIKTKKHRTKGKKKPVKKQQPSAFLAKPIKVNRIKFIENLKIVY